MKKPQLFVFILVILLTFGMAACERSASTPVPGTEGEPEFPLPDQETPSAMEVIENIATQTAQAAEGGGEAQPEADAPADTAADQPETAPEGDAAPPEGGETTTETATDADTPAETTGGNDTEQGGGQVVNEEYAVPDTYTVKAGEFPFCIARRFNISPSALLNANGLNVNSQVFPGKVLTIPKGAGSFDAGSRALAAHPTKYTVKGGDTVYSIACLFGDVDPRNIEASNNLSGGYTLSVGQVIQIP